MLEGDEPIAIVGAGIAGLTLALELARIGLSCDIYERTPELMEAGAGIQLSPNALRVLARLGLMERLDLAGTEARSVTLRSYRSGRRIATVPVASSDGTPYLSIHRADLQSVLVDAVIACGLARLHLGRTLTDAGPSGSAIHLSFAVGPDARGQGGSIRRETIKAALVIGADGVHSTLASLVNAGPVRAAGAVAWRGTVTHDWPLGPAHGLAGTSAGIEAWLGHRRHAIAYPIAGGHRTNLVLIEPTNGPLRFRRNSPLPAKAPEESAGIDPSQRMGPNTRAQCAADRFGGWDPRLHRMIAQTSDLSPWPLLDVPGNRAWRHLDNRVLLIGDAAHAMLPYAAQGAAMAIEDAAVLANRLASELHLSQALIAYEADRRPRIRRVARRVAFHRRVYHMPTPVSFGRDAVLAVAPADTLRKGLSWLYDWSPDRSDRPDRPDRHFGRSA